MFDQLVCRVMFHQMRYEGIFTPPSEQGTLVFPGNLGMFEWGGISVDPNREVAIANPMALPFVFETDPAWSWQPDGAAERCQRHGYGIRHSATVRCTVWCHAQPVPLTIWSAM
ncbi:glucose dehydrogenase [Escherichia coli]|nr:glucose dehydrogenase [Escherichia coli]